MLSRLLAASLILLAACGGDDDDDTHVHDDAAGLDASAAIDAAGPDGPPSSVVEVTPCPAQVASTVTSPSFAYTITDATIAVNDVVKFEMPAIHNAVSGTVSQMGGGSPDGKFTVGFGQTRCLRFTQAGSFPFYCSPHLFTGTITVGP